MPIYEFYCSDCHTLFNFFSSVIDTEALPDCPRCSRPDLERRPARFATLKHPGDAEPDPLGGLDEERLAGVMDSMMSELGGLEENEDPRQLARLFRQFGEASGLELGPRMQEMMSRLESGEDPDRLEEELGDDLDDDSLEEFFQLRKRRPSRSLQPAVDDTLYFL